MSIIMRLLGVERRSLEDPKRPITQAALADLLAGPKSATGRAVTPATALQLTAVYACVRLIAETFATLPAITYRRLERGKERATDHPNYVLLHDLPNPEMTSSEMRTALMGHALLWGNAYAEVVWDGAGRARELWPLRPDRTQPVRNAAGKLMYEITLPSSEKRLLQPYRVLHVRGLSFDGLVGYSPIALARESLGRAMAAEEYGARFFANDSRPGGLLRTDKKLSGPVIDRLKNDWEAKHAGLSNQHRVAVLEEGLQWQAVGIPPEDAQLLETLKYGVQDIARLYRVPLHKIGELDRATWNNIEHQGIEFVTDTMRPWLVCWEQAINKTLFTAAERKKYFVEFLVDGLLRGDAKARAEALAIQRQNGIINANEWRELENMNPYDGGDDYLVNAAMKPAGAVVAEGQEESVSEGGDE